MAERLKSSIAAAEAGMIQAARAAIAEKARIDQRLLVRVKRSGEAAARREAEARKAEAELKRRELEAKRAETEAKRQEFEAKERLVTFIVDPPKTTVRIRSEGDNAASDE